MRKFAYEKGTALLNHLGEPARRPSREAKQPAMLGYCARCDAPVTWATMPSGRRAPLDMHPEGDLVLAGGIVREYRALYSEMRRYCLHFKSCKTRTSPKT